ncbi:MAG: ATP-grasp domain-containing protein [Acidobacteriota bacterium]|jgi:D-alanine-D-alanine ligase
MKIAILYAEVNSQSSKDDLDVLVQVEAVRRSLLELGHEILPLPVTLDLQKTVLDLGRLNPDLVFNLVESLAGTGRFLHFAPALLEWLSIRFTGAGSESLYVTTNKILTKERLRYSDVDTPDWMSGSRLSNPDAAFNPPYIVKPACEDASIGLDEASIVGEREDLDRVWKEKTDRYGDCFIESFVDGREFNVSLLGNGGTGAQVLPVAEILFDAFPSGKPRIVGYEAKWESDSFEYHNTPRNFDYPAEDRGLLERLSAIAGQCWNLFDLCGYARIDFRVDQDGRPWVIEINANPCISPDAGFTAAAERAGISYNSMIERIVESASFT